MGDQQRNLNPTKEAQVAMIMWGSEYSHQGGGSMDFWDKLSFDRKQRCRLVVARMIKPMDSRELAGIQADAIMKMMWSLGFNFTEISKYADKVREEKV